MGEDARKHGSWMDVCMDLSSEICELARAFQKREMLRKRCVRSKKANRYPGAGTPRKLGLARGVPAPRFEYPYYNIPIPARVTFVIPSGCPGASL